MKDLNIPLEWKSTIYHRHQLRILLTNFNTETLSKEYSRRKSGTVVANEIELKTINTLCIIPSLDVFKDKGNYAYESFDTFRATYPLIFRRYSHGSLRNPGFLMICQVHIHCSLAIVRWYRSLFPRPKFYHSTHPPEEWCLRHFSECFQFRLYVFQFTHSFPSKSFQFFS